MNIGKVLTCWKSWVFFLIFILFLVDSLQQTLNTQDDGFRDRTKNLNGLGFPDRTKRTVVLNDTKFDYNDYDESNFCLTKAEFSKIMATTCSFFDKQKQELTQLIQDISSKQYEKLMQNINELKNELTKKKKIEKGTSSEQKTYDEHFYCQENCINAVRDCSQAVRSGVYLIHLPESGLEPFYVFCANRHVLIQRRQDGFENFNRNWNDYKHGFGNLYGEYWLGLEKIHALTKSADYELLVHQFPGESFVRKAYYSKFYISDETDGYRLTIGGYSGDAGDAMAKYDKKKFTTYDVDNDNSSNMNCASIRRRGWWYNICEEVLIPYSFDNGTGHVYLLQHLRKHNESFYALQLAIKLRRV